MSRVRTIAGKIETPEREPIAQTSARTFTRRATLVAAGVGTAAAALGLAVRFNRETPRGYVAAALDIMQKYSYRQGQVDWARVRATALAEAASATTFAETYPAIRAALERLGDRHSHLLTPARTEQLSGRSPAQPSAPKVERLGAVGYIMVPSFASINNEAGSRFALELQRMIQAVDAGDLAGWIVDLRTNGGGNMWPMIAGLGPVVGDGLLGAFVGPAGRNSWRTEWWYENGTAGERDPQTDQRSQNGYAISVGDRPYRLLNPGPAVAVLTGPQTGSSGEAVCVAFRGRPRTRSFGAATAGLSTSNSLFSLSDGAVLALTVAVMADRTGRVYGDAIEPDEVVVGKRKRNIAEDPAVLAASAWLRGG